MRPGEKLTALLFINLHQLRASWADFGNRPKVVRQSWELPALEKAIWKTFARYGDITNDTEMYRKDARKDFCTWREMYGIEHREVYEPFLKEMSFFTLRTRKKSQTNWTLRANTPHYSSLLGGPKDYTSFGHIDLNVQELLGTGKGTNMIQGSVSLNNEDRDGCTETVPRFHHNIEEYWGPRQGARPHSRR